VAWAWAQFLREPANFLPVSGLGRRRRSGALRQRQQNLAQGI